jgi:hypothetical protein
MNFKVDKTMLNIITLLAVLAAWLLLQRVLLPHLGVST